MCPRPNFLYFPVISHRRSGYTLVEILVATTLTLILMTAVVTVFGGVGEGISKSRRAMEQFDRLRTAAQQLRLDLQGVTVKLDGRPIRPEENQGYFEYIEGGKGGPAAINDQTGNSADLTVGEHADILMFTTRNAVRPFLGRYQLNVDTSNPTLQSDVAEVAWFLRGKTLHRRVLLVAPGVAQNSSFAGLSPGTFFQSNDISVRRVNGQLVPNSLGDLTKRENRFAHAASNFPFDARGWGSYGLPTLAECSSGWMSGWTSGTTPAPQAGPAGQVDYWDNANISSGLSDQALAQGQPARVADDVVLTNVIGFDVKVWEPAGNAQNNGNPGYVDLGYDGVAFDPTQIPPQGPTVKRFNHMGSSKSQLVGSPCVYDSGCFSYENEGTYNLDNTGKPTNVSKAGQGTNGMDDDNDGIVDDASESLTQLPYPVPLRGIQVTIRCYEPDSRQVRQVTIENDFLPK